MKIIYVLSLWDKVEQANCFINQALADKDALVLVHVDAKSVACINQILKSERVIVLPKHYDVSWGEYSQIETYNYLFSSALEYGPFDYLSLNSGNDLFIRPVSEFIAFLSETHKYAYYNCEPLPKSYWQYRGGFGRIAINWPKCLLRRLPDHHPLRYVRTIIGTLYHYHLIQGKALPDNIRFMGGNDWFTISYECVADMMQYVNSHPDWNDLFRHSYIGTEIYYVTLFEMLKEEREVINNNNLRYVDWKERGQKKNSGSPNILTMECCAEIDSSKRFFGRKFDKYFDEKVVDYYLKRTLC